MKKLVCLGLALTLPAKDCWAQEPQRPAPVIVLQRAAAKRENSIAAKIVWGDHLTAEEARWILENREVVVVAIRGEMEGKAGEVPSAVRRVGLWLGVLEGLRLQDAVPESQDLRIAGEIGEIVRDEAGVTSPYTAETLSFLIRGNDEDLALSATYNAKVYKLKECAPALREKIAACDPCDVGKFSPALAELDPTKEDVKALLARAEELDSIEEKACILRAISNWFRPEATAVYAKAAFETQILESEELQRSGLIDVEWAQAATARSLPVLSAAAKAKKGDGVLWGAIARLSPPEELPELINSYPGAALPLLRGAYRRMVKQPMPELAPVIYRYAIESTDGIARLPLSSEVFAVLLEGCGAEGMEAASKLAERADDADARRAVRWKKEGLSLEILVKELVQAGALANSKEADVERFVAKATWRSLSPEAYLAREFLEQRKIIAMVPLREETMPVEYPAVTNALGSLAGGALAVVETDQEVGGIEQLAEVNPDTLEVPEKVKLRYKVRVQTAGALIEFEPRDLRDQVDVEAVLEAFNAAAEKLGIAKRFGVVSQSGDEAITVFGDLPALKRILVKYGL